MIRCSRCKRENTPYFSAISIFGEGHYNESVYGFCQECTEALKKFFEQSDIDPDIDCNIFNKSEVHNNCTVEIWENSNTGKMSVGWYDNEK